jgi:hypothetical protein
LLYETGDRHVGLKTWNGTKWCDASGDRIQFHHVHGDDPYVLACSLNIRRRHLTAEQKRDLIAKLVKATPEKSNRLIAHQVKVSHPTVAKVRKQLEQAGDVEKVSHVDRLEGPETTGEEVEAGSEEGREVEAGQGRIRRRR